MPNWILNKVTFGDKEVIKDCVKKENGVDTFDFNKVVPMPKEFDNTDSPNRNEKQVLELTKKYGSGDWYDWRLKHWGVKWNPSETVVVDKYNVEFQTPWNTPLAIFKAISKKYHTSVSVEYADEDLGNNCGIVKFDDNGLIIDDVNCDFDFACSVWGFDPEEERKLYEEV